MTWSDQADPHRSPPPQPSQTPDSDRHGRYRHEAGNQESDIGVQLPVTQEYPAQHVQVITDRIGVNKPSDPDRQLNDPAAAEGVDAQLTQLEAQVAGNVKEADAADDATQWKY